MEGLGDVTLHLVRSMSEVEEFKRWLGERRPVMCVDTETEGLLWWQHRVRLVQFGDGQSAWAIPWERWAGCVYEALKQYEGEIVCHNLKYDAHILKQWGGIDLPWHRVHDTMILAHLEWPDEPVALKSLTSRLIDPKAAVASRILDAAMTEQKWTWATVPIEFEPYWAYGALDTVLTAKLFEKLQPTVENRRRVYDLEMAVMRVIFNMECRGMRIDVPYVEKTLIDFETFIASVENWCEEAHGVRPGQNEKVAQRLIELGVDLHEKTATGKWKLDKSVLLGADHELATMVYRRRRAQKLASSYLLNFLKDQVDGLVHADVRQLGARTGRMSVTRPALQTLPRGNIVRGSFVPDDETQALLSADYDQIEMRLLAHFSGDPRMIEGIEYGDQMRAAGYNGYDLHSMNARGIYGIPVGEPVPKKQRDVTKNAGFAKAYGAGVERFSITAKVDVETGKAFLDQYDRTFPGVRAFQRKVEQIAKERMTRDGRPWAQSPIGRYHPGEPGKEYALTNYLIQGTAADVFKEGLVRLDAAGLGEHIRCLVHDEVIFSVPREGAADVQREIERSMEDRQQFRVPLTTECSAPLSRWGEKYDYSEFDAADMVYAEGDD